MSNPKVSVLLTVRNGEKYIKKTIQSILSQTFRYFEFIIIDNNSIDKTLDIVSSFTDYRIDLIKLEKNYGQTKALNLGLEKCKGKYIARIDADDIAEKSRLAVQLNFLENNKNINILSSQVNYIDQFDNIIGKSKFINLIGDYSYYILISNQIAHPSVMFKKEFIEALGKYDEKIQYWQDLDLWLKATQKNKIFIIDDYLTNIRIHHDQISSKKNKLRKIETNKELIELTTNFVNNNKIPANIDMIVKLKIKILKLSEESIIKVIYNVLIFIILNFKYIVFNKILYISVFSLVKKKLLIK